MLDTDNLRAIFLRLLIISKPRKEVQRCKKENFRNIFKKVWSDLPFKTNTLTH